jgi:hypothetical protein
MLTPAAIQFSVEPSPGRLHLRARLIAGVARAQLGLVASQDIVALKLSRSAVARRLASRAWRRVFPGVYAMDDSPDTPLQLRKAAQLWDPTHPVARPGARGDPVQNFRTTCS